MPNNVEEENVTPPSIIPKGEENKMSVKEPRKCLFEFTCQCGLKIVFQNDLKDHYFKCSQMKAYYSYLFNTIVKYNPKDLGIE
jgi:hypothetical protein